MALWVCINKDCPVTLYGGQVFCPTCGGGGSLVKKVEMWKCGKCGEYKVTDTICHCES